MKWRVVRAKACGRYSLDLPLLEGQILEPLRDPAVFAGVTLDASAAQGSRA
jgi:hypothetical protein